ncbi:MAG: hypothetical protein KDH15_19915 [Rhodocyclaceae bacterium]|nr:hypothetical protein [Rhodocyclaceae bacterium]
MLRRFAAVLLMALVTGSGWASSNYQDWWWDPAQSGMGWNVAHQGDVLAIAWFHYDATGKASFLTLAGTLDGETLTGNLIRSSGPLPGPGFDPAAVANVPVGTATLEFTSSNSAVFTYSYDGLSGTVNLQRFGFAEDDFSGTMAYSATGTLTGCADPDDDGAYRESGLITASHSRDVLTLTLTIDGDNATCTYTAALSAEGSLHQAEGSFSCNDGENGTIELRDIRSTEDYLMMEFTGIDSGVSDTCVATGHLIAVRP